MTPCSVEGCDRKHYGRGWCRMHYQQAKAHGSPGAKMNTLDYFWRNVRRGGLNDCWLWLGTINNMGYGVHKRRAAHRVVFELLVGPIPQGLQLDHLCRVTACVNPRHLEPVTPKENMQRSRWLRDACKNGHEWTPENTKIFRGYRVCRACQRAWYLRKKETQRCEPSQPVNGVPPSE